MTFNNIQIDVFIILLLKLLYVALIRGKDDRMDADIKELSTILDKIKTEPDIHYNIFKRKVTMDDDQIGSIDEYYHSGVTKDNVYKIFHVLNIALSCEYSEIAYDYITLSDRSINGCLSKVKKQEHQMQNLLKDCLKNYYSTYVTYIMKHTEIMVLSLAYMMKFAKNPVFKYHDVLKYLLLWYTFTYHNYHSGNKKKLLFWYGNPMSHIKPIKLTNFQIKSSLKRFIVKHCRNVEYFESDSYKADPKAKVEVDVLIKTIGGILKSLAIPDYDSVQTKSVINSSDADLRTLISLLNSQVPRGSIEIPMINRKIQDVELADMQKVFDKSIKDSLELDEIIIYNHTIIQVVYEIIIRHEIEAVNKIVTDKNVLNKDGECFKLLNKLENYIKNLSNNASYEQSILLRRKLLENRESLADVCWLMKDTGEHEEINNVVADWKETVKWVHEIKSNAEFGVFLESLSKILIAAKFHPAVLNAFSEKTVVVYEAKHIWFYGWDMKLYTMYNNSVDNKLCVKIWKTMKLLKSIQENLRHCLESEKPVNSTTTFHEELNEAIVDIANITRNVPPQYSIDWEKILLTLLHNKNNTRPFDAQEQKTLNEVHVKRLISFLYTMHNLLREKRFVLCSCGASSNPDVVEKCAGSFEGDWTEDVNNIDEIEDVTKLHDLKWYRKEFQIITGRIEKLNAEFKSQMDIMIYWDGNKKHLRDVYNSYKEQVFDIQDAQDYANFFVKWVIAVPYTRLMLLVHRMADNNFKDVNNKQIEDIRTRVVSFLNLVVLPHPSVSYYFTHLFATLESLIDKNINDSKCFLEEPYDKIGIINVVAMPALSGDYSEWISEFLSEIDQLVSFLTLSEDEEIIMDYP